MTSDYLRISSRLWLNKSGEKRRHYLKPISILVYLLNSFLSVCSPLAPVLYTSGEKTHHSNLAFYQISLWSFLYSVPNLGFVVCLHFSMSMNVSLHLSRYIIFTISSEILNSLWIWIFKLPHFEEFCFRYVENISNIRKYRL